MGELDTYIKNASESIFRYEGLQDYTAEDGEEFVKNFIETGTISFSPELSEWWQNLKKKNESGIRTYRVRLVTYPMTDYTKAELTALKESSVFSGEDIRVITKDKLSAIAADLQDYYLIDNKYLFLMKYGTKGKYLGSTLAKGEQVKEYIRFSLELAENSIPIIEYLKR
jgi:hypothetical protein